LILNVTDVPLDSACAVSCFNSDSPSDLIASAYACDQMDSYWQDNSDNETQFRIERSSNGNDYTKINSVGADITSYSDTTVAENTTYWYRVRAYNSYGYSDYSNTDSDTTPAFQLSKKWHFKGCILYSAMKAYAIYR